MVRQAIAAGGLPDRRVLQAARSFHWLVGGRKRLSKWLAPP
jgi:hypothetical protein